ncbi:MAG: FHA domain-containing protein [Anaerolineales bacterium]|jgi:pSer/pThr/pTyr-binding forkhead associated (FHA) protein|nr:FHA domain-containing protein [Chloroflexota bacterium]MCC6986671.1 FHA domain-containing protein [Anaerolineales bacterium]
MSGVIVLALRLLATAALYGFLAWAFIFLFRETRRQAVTLTNRRVPGIGIMIKFPGGHGTLRHFNQAAITIGRDPGCDIPLSNDTVSARHAHLIYHHNQWWIEDLASTNGTKLNDTPVSIPTVITSGDELQCGGISLSVSLSENVVIEPTQRLEKRNTSRLQ